jgi:dTDP-L-rhamnose 4-epimerase
MRVLVTGAAGFIGSHIASALQEAGHEVRGLDSLTPAVHNGRPSDCVLDLVVGDVRDPAAVDQALAGIDAVCHQAAMVGLGVDLSDLSLYSDVNVTGTAVLLEAMGRHGIGRLVFASSMVVYGEGAYDCAAHGRVRPSPRDPADLAAGVFEPRCPVCGAALSMTTVTEDAPLDPRNAYAMSKVAQEHLAASWARLTGGTAVGLRYHNVYGPRMPRDTPYSGVAAIFRSRLENGLPPLVFEDGGQRRDFVHVRDVARANLLALEGVSGVAAGLPSGLASGPVSGSVSRLPSGLASGLAPGPASGLAGGGLRCCNVASGEPHTVGEMACALAEAFGASSPVVTGDYRLGDVRHIVASPAGAARDLGFRAQIGFAAGMAEFARAPLREPVPARA